MPGTKDSAFSTGNSGPHVGRHMSRSLEYSRILSRDFNYIIHNYKITNLKVQTFLISSLQLAITMYPSTMLDTIER